MLDFPIVQFKCLLRIKHFKKKKRIKHTVHCQERVGVIFKCQIKKTKKKSQAHNVCRGQTVNVNDHELAESFNNYEKTAVFHMFPISWI